MKEVFMKKDNITKLIKVRYIKKYLFIILKF